jgi:hypothetical protein
MFLGMLALRCNKKYYIHLSLCCGVFVRLHLALFPAGGPFLPSLYVNLYISFNQSHSITLQTG